MTRFHGRDCPCADRSFSTRRAGKSTLLKLLTGENEPSTGKVNRNGRLRIGYFAQHHLDQLDLDLSPVAFLASKFPGKDEQEYRQHLGGFGITGMTGLQTLKTLSGGQKSRVTFALLSLQRYVVHASTWAHARLSLTSDVSGRSLDLMFCF